MVGFHELAAIVLIVAYFSLTLVISLIINPQVILFVTDRKFSTMAEYSHFLWTFSEPSTDQRPSRISIDTLISNLNKSIALRSQAYGGMNSIRVAGSQNTTSKT